MPVKYRTLILQVIISFLLFSFTECVQAQELLHASFKSATNYQADATNDTSGHVSRSISENKSVIVRPWQSSFYILGGLGYPYRPRFEVGYNFGTFVGLGVTFGSMRDYFRPGTWKTLGILGKLNFPVTRSSALYLLLGHGGSIEFSEMNYSYNLVYAGYRLPLSDWLEVCPELGAIFSHLFVPNEGYGSLDENDSKSDLGFNISLEINFARFF